MSQDKDDIETEFYRLGLEEGQYGGKVAIFWPPYLPVHPMFGLSRQAYDDFIDGYVDGWIETLDDSVACYEGEPLAIVNKGFYAFGHAEGLQCAATGRFYLQWPTNSSFERNQDGYREYVMGYVDAWLANREPKKRPTDRSGDGQV